MLLAEEFLLLALDPAKGRPLGLGNAIRLGLCGALLSELALRQKVTVVAGRVQVADPGPTCDDLRDEVLRLVAAHGERPMKVKGQVRALRWSLENVRDRVASRLVVAGVLAEERPRLAGMVPVTRYPVLDRETHQRLREEVRGWVADSTSSDQGRVTTLVALLGACQLLASLWEHPADRRRAFARARAAIYDVPAARAVKAILR